MPTENHEQDASRVFWSSFDAAWHDSGEPTAEKISRRLLQTLDYNIASTTIRSWLNHRALPRNVDAFAVMCTHLFGDDRARDLSTKLEAAKRERAVGLEIATPVDSSARSTLKKWPELILPFASGVSAVIAFLALIAQGLELSAPKLDVIIPWFSFIIGAVLMLLTLRFVVTKVRKLDKVEVSDPEMYTLAAELADQQARFDEILDRREGRNREKDVLR